MDNLHKDNERIMTELTSEIEHKKLLEVLLRLIIRDEGELNLP